MCEDLISKEVCLIDENMVGNMACIHARKMSEIKAKGEQTEGEKELNNLSMKQRQEMAVREIECLGSYIDISMNSLHETFYLAAINRFVNFFNSASSFETVEQHHMVSFGQHSHKIIEQLAKMNEYKLMQKFFVISSAFHGLQPEYMYAYLVHCINSGNESIVDQAIAYLKNLEENVFFIS